MADIITAAAQATPVKINKETAKALKEAELLIAGGLEFKKFAPIAIAAGVEKVKNEKLYLAYGLGSAEEYCEKFGMSRRSMYSYLKVADIAREHIAAQTGEKASEVVLDRATITQHFAKVKRAISMDTLIESSRDLNTLENYLSGGEIKTGEIAKILGGKESKALPESTDEKPAAREDIFKRMQSKGYKWNKETKQFENPDGTALTRQQIGELVEAKDVTDFLDSLAARIDATTGVVTTQLDTYEPFFDGFVSVSHSPEVLNKLTEQTNALLKKIETLKGAIIERLPEKD